jgi:mRNA interferase MazF
MRRGEIWLADLEPARGSQADKVRPVVIVSNDASNRVVRDQRRGACSAVPLTSNVTHTFAFQVLLPADETGLGHDSKAQAEQVRSLDVSRFRNRIGRVPPHLLWRLEDALRIHLGL